ncbi:DnaJ domain-containing protein [Cryptosporidium ubiquitum]|uniref:DnaJ domain-containing protein n=1 Tax=Cryptosporidium ubiquitum TaxID=857276 RepID=A0A1J4MP64_9CRYT|nr:DnaJ domain-containing protein [Cryptosporidium ubiquitum]OII74669.1 DnaJ domain-containing protein [Cryptosporidium ubiquitum]
MDSRFNKFYNAFKLLGVEVGASFKEIKSSFRSLAKKTHPDKNRGGDEKLAHENFTILRDSYLLLCNEVERKQFEKEWASFNSNNISQKYEGKANNHCSLNFNASEAKKLPKKGSNDKIRFESLNKESIHLINAFKDRFKPRIVKIHKGISKQNLRGALNHAHIDKIVDKFSEFEKMVVFKLAEIIQTYNN